MPQLETLELVLELPVPPAVLQARWLDPTWHARFTGGAAATYDPASGAYTAWDGYIEGVTLEETPGRLVQSWRSADFADDDAASRLELRFEAAGRGTRLTLRQSEIPAGQGAMYRTGWEDHYFVHMREVLGA